MRIAALIAAMLASAAAFSAVNPTATDEQDFSCEEMVVVRVSACIVKAGRYWCDQGAVR